MTDLDAMTPCERNIAYRQLGTISPDERKAWIEAHARTTQRATGHPMTFRDMARYWNIREADVAKILRCGP